MGRPEGMSSFFQFIQCGILNEKLLFVWFNYIS